MEDRLARIMDLSHRGAPTKTDDDTSEDVPVALDGDQLVIRGLTVRGAPAEAVRHCIDHGGDAEEVTRQMLDIGGVVLQHGANSTLVQAVISEMRSEGVTQESLRGMAERVAAKGLRYEEQVQPMLEAAFASRPLYIRADYRRASRDAQPTGRHGASDQRHIQPHCTRRRFAARGGSVRGGRSRSPRRRSCASARSRSPS